jgi:antitoxin component YwqK of YwqJK toxin-antitoxin module
MDDLVERDGIHYKKFTDVPFDGEIEGRKQVRFKNGKEEGPLISYWDNGQLHDKGEYKNGKKEGSWVSYWNNGQLWRKGAYKNGEKEGRWVHYDPNGNLTKEYSGVYENGVKISD